LDSQRKGWSIRIRLMLIALAVAVPFLLLSAGIVWQLAETERQTRREAILFSARTLMNAVDATLSKHVAVARMLSTSPALMADDLEAFRKEAERAMPALSGGWVVISDRDGQQILNLLRPAGEPLPRRSARALETQRRALDTGQIQISDVFIGGVTQRPLVGVEVPILRPGRPPLDLILIMETTLFLPLFDQQYLPDGWLGGLIDRKGNFIARSRDHDRNVGQPASEGFRAASREAKEGWREMVSVEGISIANGHVTSELSGWVMGLAADKDTFEAPVRRTILFGVLAGGVATLLSVLLAVWAAGRIARPIERIAHGTQSLLQRTPVSFAKTGVAEVDRALEAFTATAGALELHEKDRDQREAHVRLIMRELSHRSKNLLAIILAIARQTSRQSSTFQEFETRFNARIQALADAHDLLVEQQWVGAALENLIRAQVSAFSVDQVTLRGEPVMLRAEAVQNVGLALHELATNASKYGALSVPEGRVAVEWSLRGDPPNRSLHLIWRETGGPAVKPPARTGFGRFVLERVTVSALGKGALDFSPSGLVWTCEINPEHLVQQPGKAAA
jgi:two-component sensor histidine kinase